MGRSAKGNIDPVELLSQLGHAPATAAKVAKDLGFAADSVARRLVKLGKLGLAHRPTGSDEWHIGGAGIGFTLAGAADTTFVNSAVFDPYVRPIRGTSTRREQIAAGGAAGDCEPVLYAMAQQMRRTLDATDNEVRARINKIAFAVPFSVDGQGRTAHGQDARSVLTSALKEADVELAVDGGELYWAWSSDVAAEGAFEYRRRAGARKRPAPILIVKTAHDIRCAVITERGPHEGQHGSDSNLGRLRPRVGADNLLAPEHPEPPGDQLSALVAPTRLYTTMVDADTQTADFRFGASTTTYTDADIFEEIFRSLSTGATAQAERVRQVLHDAGEILGQSLDGAITAVDPQAVIITGFLARDGGHLRDGVQLACSHHRAAGVEFELASGIEAETITQRVKDAFAVEGTLGDPVGSEDLPNQFRVTAGAAFLVADRYRDVELNRLDQAIAKKPAV